MVSQSLEEHLKDMGILEVKPKKVAPVAQRSGATTDVVLPKKEVKYIYNDPRDPITGEVPF